VKSNHGFTTDENLCNCSFLCTTANLKKLTPPSPHLPQLCHIHEIHNSNNSILVTAWTTLTPSFKSSHMCLNFHYTPSQIKMLLTTGCTNYVFQSHLFQFSGCQIKQQTETKSAVCTSTQFYDNVNMTKKKNVPRITFILWWKSNTGNGIDWNVT
jgi:hypothetical protein